MAAPPSLYEPQAPAGSAFVRVVNVTSAAATLQLDKLPVIALQPGQVGEYRTVLRVAGRAIDLELRAGRSRTRIGPRLEAGAVVTVLVLEGPDGPLLRVVNDQASFNQSRALLSFYNALGSGPGPDSGASLMLEPGGQPVFAAVPCGEGRARAINPAHTLLRASCGDRSGTVALDGAEIGERYSVWLLPRGAGVNVLLTKDVLPGTSPSRLS